MERLQTSLEYIVHPSDADHPTQLEESTNRINDGNQDRFEQQDAGPKTSSKPKRKRQHSRAEASYPRKRAIQACSTCRFRRTKCDNSRPSCSNCAGLGVECVYQQNDPSTFDPASLTILRRLDQLEELVRAKSSPILSFNSQNTPNSSPLTTPKNQGPPTLERPADWKPSYINIEAVLTWPIFHDQNFQERLDLKALLRSVNDKAQPPIMSVSPDIDLNAAGKLLQQFLDNVHIFNPILEERKVREYMRFTSFNGLGWDAQSCLLLLIYALGSIASPYKSSQKGSTNSFRKSLEFRHAESFFFAAQKRMGLLLCGSSVVEAQCFFLAGVYLMATFRPVEAWKMFVQALACCQGFYTHHVAHVMQSEDESRLQQSIYWTCFKSELEIRLELNVSEKSAWDLTYPAFFPSPPEGLKSQGEAVWYFYLAEIALRRLGNRILNYIYKYDSSKDSEINIEDAIHDFEEQADGWLQSLPATLALDTNSSQNKQYAALRFILNGHLLDCKEMMYWHFVVDAVQGGMLWGSREAFMRKGLLACVERIQINEEGFYHRHHGTWLMLRSCTRSALVLLAAAMCSELEASMPLDWEEAIHKVMLMLNFWKDNSPDVLDRLDIVQKLAEIVSSRIRQI